MWSTPTQTKKAFPSFLSAPPHVLFIPELIAQWELKQRSEHLRALPTGNPSLRLQAFPSFHSLPRKGDSEQRVHFVKPALLCSAERQHPVFRNNLLSGNSEQSSSSYAGASQFLFQGHLFVLIEIHLHKVTVYVPVPPPVTRWRLGQCGMLSFTQMPAYIKRHVIGENYNRWRLEPF